MPWFHCYSHEIKQRQKTIISLRTSPLTWHVILSDPDSTPVLCRLWTLLHWPVYNDHADVGVCPVVMHETLDSRLQRFKCQPAADHQMTTLTVTHTHSLQLDDARHEHVWQTRRSAIADCTARRVKRETCILPIGVCPFRFKFYGNGVSAKMLIPFDR